MYHKEMKVQNLETNAMVMVMVSDIILVTLEGNIRKMFRAVRHILEEIAGKRYQKLPKNSKIVLKHALYLLDTLGKKLSFNLIICARL